MILGEIIIDKELEKNNLIENLKNKSIVKIKTDSKINPKIPTQIIGWNKTKEILGNSVNILNKIIKKNLYWTFNPNEKLQDFNEDVYSFINYLYGDFVDGLNYEFIDPIIYEVKTFQDFKNKFNINILNHAYFTDDFIYIYEEEKTVIYGFDLNYNNFLKINNSKLIEDIKKNTNNVSVETYELETSVYQKLKLLFDKEIDKKYIPVFEFHLNDLK